MEITGHLGKFLNSAAGSPKPRPTLSDYPSAKQTTHQKTFTSSNTNLLQNHPPSTNNPHIDVWGLREQARSILISTLQNYNNKKYLSLDPSITGPIGLLIDADELRNQGVSGWAECGPNPLPRDIPQIVIFICQTDLSKMKSIINQIEEVENVDANRVKPNFFSSTANPTTNSSSTSPTSTTPVPLAISSFFTTTSISRQYVILFIPTISEACFLYLSNSNIFSRVKIEIKPLPLFFIPLDEDLLSMEMDNALEEIHSDNYTLPLLHVSQGLTQLQLSMDNPIPHIHAIGKASQFIVELLARYRREHFDAYMEKNMGKLNILAQVNDKQKNFLKTSSPLLSGESYSHPFFHLPLDDTDNQIASTNQILSHVMKDISSNQYHDSSHIENFSENQSDFTTKKSIKTEFSPPPHISFTTNLTSQSIENVEHLIIFDRKVDFYSPLCSPFTYEALLDLFYGIHCSQLNITAAEAEKSAKLKTSESDITNNNPTTSSYTKSKQNFTSKDPFYSQIRNLHQYELGPFLSQKIYEIQQTYQEKDNLKSIPETYNFVKRFVVKQQEHLALSAHIDFATYIDSGTKNENYQKRMCLENEIVQSNGKGLSNEHLNTILDMIDEAAPIEELYRLLSLASVINQGIRSKSLDQIKSAIIHQYGFEEFIRFQILENIGLLRQSNSIGPWETIKKKFNLLVEESSSQSDISIVFSGYAPLSVRLIQMLFNNPGGWKNCKEHLSLLFGPAIEVEQRPLPRIVAGRAIQEQQEETDFIYEKENNKTSKGNSTDTNFMFPTAKSTSSTIMSPYQKQQIVIIFFIGGVTYAEIAAIRKLAQMENNVRKYIIMTTNILNSRRFFKSLQKLLPKPFRES